MELDLYRSYDDRLIVLNIIPIFQTIYQSFFKTGDFGKGNTFVGLANYQKVFGDTEVWQALWNTVEVCNCGGSDLYCDRSVTGV